MKAKQANKLVAGQVIEIDPIVNAVREARSLSKAIKALERQLEKYKSMVKNHMKDNGMVAMEVDMVPVTLTDSERRSFDIDKAVAKHGEELVNEFVTVTQVTSLRLN